MTTLPRYFPTEKLDIIERTQIEWFFKRYTGDFYAEYKFGHFILAAYAAIPAYISPDLLYKLWQNFAEYEWNGEPAFIDSIAVNDVLQAPFCSEVSYELFKMQEKTRLAFLRWMTLNDPWWQGLKPRSIVEIAGFIERYHDRPNDTVLREGARYREEQLMEVKVYTDPGAVVNFYLDKLSKAKKDDEILSVISALTKAEEKETYTQYSEQPVFSGIFGENELSLWRHAIQGNAAAFANLLKASPENNGNFSLLVNETSTQYTIKVNSSQTSVVNQLNSSLKAKNYAIIIGCSANDEVNCSTVSEALETLNADWQIFSFTGANRKANLLERLSTILSKVTSADNLLFYLSSGDATLYPDGSCGVDYFGRVITDIEFNAHLGRVNPASCTLVLECRNAATDKWINTNKPGYSLFTAEQPDRGFKPETVSVFTKAFCDILKRHEGKITNRRLCIEMAQEIGRKSKVNTLLLSNPKTYYRRFASAETQRMNIQHHLCLAGYLDDGELSNWSGNMQNAIKKFSQEKGIGTAWPDVAKALEDKIEADKKEKKPLLLFVFSDKEKKLSAIAEEIQAIKTHLRNGHIDKYNEIRIFQNKPLKDVDDFMKSRAARNRVQLFYYSGFGERDALNFTDAKMDLALWSDWLTYQDNLELAVFNCCRAAYMASMLTQVGVGMAMGSQHAISDKEGAEFGSRLMQGISRREDLSVMPEQ